MSGCSQRRIGSPAFGSRAVLWRHYVFAAVWSPTIARHRSRSCFPGAAAAQFRKGPRVFSMSFFEAWAASRSSNQSLERTPDEQSCCALSVVSGRRSALRWARLKAKERVFQMSDFERRDSSIRGSSIPVAVGQCGPECGLVIPESTFGA